MLKFSLCTFVFGALLGGATSDFICILREFTVVTPDYFFLNPVSSCQDVEGKFRRVREDLKTCTSLEINSELLESLYNDFCTLDSDFRRNYIKSRRCFLENLKYVKNCILNIALAERNNSGISIKEKCTRSNEEIRNCSKDNLEKPCGDVGMKMYQRISEATQPFYMAICMDVPHARAEDDKPRVNEMAQYKYDYIEFSGAVSNSAFIWIMLLGVLLTVIWY